MTVADWARVLDQFDPNWYRRVRAPIDLSSCDQCIVGQAFGNFFFHLEDLFTFASELGYTASADVFCFSQYEPEWRHEIAVRNLQVGETKEVQQIEPLEDPVPRTTPKQTPAGPNETPLSQPVREPAELVPA